MRAIKILALICIAYLILLEVARVYFIMPFPGSQQKETIDFAYFLHNTILYFRIMGWAVLVLSGLLSLSSLSKPWKLVLAIGVVLYGVVFYLFNFRFLADKMFYQPENIVFHDLIKNKVEQSKLILGVTLNGEAKAYPIEIIGYHHQVRDSIGGLPVMVTYCTVCRTGRVFSPMVNGVPENFRLVGMDHFNAMFEDQTTKSWWRQATGEAITGTLTGRVLDEIPSEQMSLRAWLNLFPDSKILQPDSLFVEKYKKLEGFDLGTIDSHLLYKDSLSWMEKSWVVGVTVRDHSRAYDWNDLMKNKIINDTLGGTSLLLYLQPDSVSFNVWKRDTLEFSINNGKLQDRQTNSLWNTSGICVEGILTGNQLQKTQAYQEFWHSWRTFHPATTRYLLTK